MNNNKNIQSRIIELLLWFMPFHTLVCEFLIKSTNIDNLWRDILIIILFLITISNNMMNSNAAKYVMTSIFIVLLFLCFANDYTSALNISRIYIIPPLLFFSLLNINISDYHIKKWLEIILSSAVIVSVYGMIQAFVLKDEFLIKLGYASDISKLPSVFYLNGFWGYQRVTGTFISPNTCGVFLGITILVYLIYIRNSCKNRILSAIICSVALICTFSRSSILGLILTLVFLVLNNKKNITKKNIKYIKKSLLIIFLLIILFYYIDQIFIDGIVSNMIRSALKINDLSAKAHFNDLYEPIETVIENPFGLGFGNNGPKSDEISGNKVESSIYLVMYDFGIIGGLLFLSPFIYALWIGYKKRDEALYKLLLLVSLFMLITFVFLPNVQEYENLFYFYFIFGLVENDRINKKKLNFI